MFRLSLDWLKNNPPFLAIWLSSGFQFNDDWEKKQIGPRDFFNSSDLMKVFQQLK